MPAPSANTQAVLLLTSPLLQEEGRGRRKDPLLTADEYSRLATCLQHGQHQPADLINGAKDALLKTLSESFAADSLEKVSPRPMWRQALLDGRLLLLSSDVPSARFQVWGAMGRNQLIYALADAALVVSSARGEGGTWAGATEQLQTLHFCPVHVLGDPRGGPGLAALAELGARPWPEQESPEALQALLATGIHSPTTAAPSTQVEQHLLLQQAPPSPAASLDPQPEPVPPTAVQKQAMAPATALAAFIDDLLLSLLDRPLSLEELAALLEVSKAEVKRWCLRLVEQDKVRKLIKPVRYERQASKG